MAALAESPGQGATEGILAGKDLFVGQKQFSHEAGMKIALISDSFPPQGFGGIGIAHFGLYKILRQNNFDVQVFTFDDRGCDSVSSPGIFRFGVRSAFIVRAINFANRALGWLLAPGRIFYQVKDIFLSAWGSFMLSRALNAFDPDVIIISDQGCPLLFTRAGKRASVILITHHLAGRFTGLPELGKISALYIRLATFF